MRLPVLLVLLVCLMLSGCPKDAAAPVADASTPAVITEASDAAKAIGAPGEVDYRCQTDADCEIKDVGNCCGYYPSCVNADSATFPEQVKAACEAEGRMSVCGFPELKGCRCVDNRCEGIRGDANALPVQ